MKNNSTKIIITLTDHSTRIEVSGEVVKSENELMNRLAVTAQPAIIHALKGSMEKGIEAVKTQLEKRGNFH